MSSDVRSRRFQGWQRTKEALLLKNGYNEIWRRGHRRIWIDNIIYSSWVSAKLKCGYQDCTSLPWNEEKVSSRSFQKFPCCFLSLLYTPHLTVDLFVIRGKNAAFASSATSRKDDKADGPSSKRQRHFEGEICFIICCSKCLPHLRDQPILVTAHISDFLSFLVGLNLYYISQIIGPQDVGAYLLRILLPTK